MHQCLTHTNLIVDYILTGFNILMAGFLVFLYFKDIKLNKESKRIHEECFRVITGSERK